MSNYECRIWGTVGSKTSVALDFSNYTEQGTNWGVSSHIRAYLL